MTRLEPVHPSEVLTHDLMEPSGLPATALAPTNAIGPPPGQGGGESLLFRGHLDIGGAYDGIRRCNYHVPP